MNNKNPPNSSCLLTVRLYDRLTPSTETNAKSCYEGME